MLGDHGWRAGWLALSGLSLLALPLCWRWLSAAGVQSDAPPPAATHRYPFVALLVAYFCEGAGYIVTGTFGVAALAQAPEGWLSGKSYWIVAGLAAAPSTVLWALLGRRIGLIAALVAAHVLQVVGIALPVTSASSPAAAMSAALFGGTFMGITALTLALGSALAGPMGGRAIGLLTAAFGTGQAIGPAAAGIVIERSGGYETALLVAAGIVAAGAVVLALGQARAGPPKTPTPRPGTA